MNEKGDEFLPSLAFKSLFITISSSLALCLDCLPWCQLWNSAYHITLLLTIRYCWQTLWTFSPIFSSVSYQSYLYSYLLLKRCTNTCFPKKRRIKMVGLHFVGIMFTLCVHIFPSLAVPDLKLVHVVST